jgi:hypothetical protein
LLWFVGFRWFWDLTSDFWAVFEENSCKGKKAGDLWVKMCGGLLRNSSLGVLRCAQDDSNGKTKTKTKTKAKAKARAGAKAKARLGQSKGKDKGRSRSPFDFAQGRLFGE